MEFFQNAKIAATRNREREEDKKGNTHDVGVSEHHLAYKVYYFRSLSISLLLHHSLCVYKKTHESFDLNLITTSVSLPLSPSLFSSLCVAVVVCCCVCCCL